MVVRTGCCCAVGIPGKYDGANGRPIIDLAALGVLANLTLIGSVKPQRREIIHPWNGKSIVGRTMFSYPWEWYHSVY